MALSLPFDKDPDVDDDFALDTSLARAALLGTFVEAVDDRGSSGFDGREGAEASPCGERASTRAADVVLAFPIFFLLDISSLAPVLEIGTKAPEEDATFAVASSELETVLAIEILSFATVGRTFTAMSSAMASPDVESIALSRGSTSAWATGSCLSAAFLSTSSLAPSSFAASHFIGPCSNFACFPWSICRSTDCFRRCKSEAAFSLVEGS